MRDGRMHKTEIGNAIGKVIEDATDCQEMIERIERRRFRLAVELQQAYKKLKELNDLYGILKAAAPDAIPEIKEFVRPNSIKMLNEEFNDAEVIEIRELYNSRQCTQTKIAELFNVSVGRINNVVNMKTYKNVGVLE
jgi:dsDNA-specific endonuclease/ATPase MutS2